MLYPGIFSSPNNIGFVGSDKSITNNGSVWTKVTIYALLSKNLTEYIFSPFAKFSKLPIIFRFSFNIYKLFVLFSSFKFVLLVVAILKFPSFSSIEN